MSKSYILRIFRGTSKKQYWEEFEVPLMPSSNVISGLMHIQKNPINRAGKRVTPVVWEQGCLEEVCGSCTMLVNGHPCQSCSVIIENIIEETGSNIISLAPMTKYTLVRDLAVDRSRMFESLKHIHGWIDADGSFIKGFGPKISPNTQEAMYILSTCMTCGCCTEACPQFDRNAKFIGPAAISQVRLFNLNPTGKRNAKERLKPLMDEGGLSECGNAQNCVQVCPKEIPLTESIAVMGRETTKQGVKDFFNIPDRE